MSEESTRVRRAWILSCLALAWPVAYAQESGQTVGAGPVKAGVPVRAAAPSAAAAADSSSQLEEVVVTATGTNISGVTPVGSESLSLTRDQILDTGFTDIHDVVRSLPQVVDVAPAGVANYREGGTTAYGGNVTQGTSLNLRGLGPQATLVLVDGHRVAPTGSQGVFTDANQVPLAALERIEILSDGNSAIYGSDAVGGVINYMLRKDLQGVEVAGRSTFVDGYDEYGGSITGGHTWSELWGLGKGNFILSVDYDWRGAMAASASPLTADRSVFGGIDNRIRGSTVTTGAVNGGVGPGQPGNVSTPGATGNVNWCDRYNPGFPPFVPASCTSNTYLYRGLPAGTGVPSFAGTSATPSLTNRSDDQDYLGRRWRWQVAAFANQELTPRVGLSFEGFWSKRDVWTRGSQYQNVGSLNVTVNPGSPFYITPTGTAGGPMIVNMPFTALGVPLWYTDNPDTNWTAIAGLKAQLAGDWASDLSVSVGRDRTCGVCQIGYNIDPGALQHQVNIGAINPLSSAPLTQAQIASFVGSNVQTSQMGIEDYVLKFNGSLFNLPAGAVKLAFGGEFIHNTEHIQNGANRTDIPAEGIAESSLPPPQGYSGIGCSAPLPCPPRTQPNQFAWDNISSDSRKISSGFLELYVPIVAPASDVPLVKSLSLDAAARYDHYSDFGSTRNPKVGLTWSVNDDLSLRGSWGTSFRAPSLTDINPFVFSAKVYVANFPNFTGNPNIDGLTLPGIKLSNVALVVGDTPNIQPERAHNWSFGLDLTPHWVEHLKVSATYYHIHYSDQIFSPPAFPAALLSPQSYQLYAAFVHPVHNPANCTPGNPATYDPALLPYANAVGIYGIVTSAQLCKVQAWVDTRLTNIGSSTQGGVDVNVSYALDTSVGNWNLGVDVTKVINQSLAAVATVPEREILGTLGNLVPWRGRTTLGWHRGPLNVTLFANYVGRYLNNAPLVGQSSQAVPSWTTFDLNLGFDFGALPGPSFLHGTLLSVSAQNLFARDPPIVLQANGAQFDANDANLFGRIVSVQLTKRF